MGFYVVPHAQRKGEGSSDRVISATGKAGRQAGVGRIEARLSRATSNMHATNIVSMRIPICVQKSAVRYEGSLLVTTAGFERQTMQEGARPPTG